MTARPVTGTALLLASIAGGIAALPGGVHAQAFGRLFTTPAERIQLDDLRREYEYGVPVTPQVDDAPEPEDIDPLVSSLTINGVVLRSSGRNSTWVNGDRVSRGAPTREGLVVREEPGVAVRIRLPSGTETVMLKPGQKIDVDSGQVLDAYEYRPDAEAGAEAFALPGADGSEASAPDAEEPAPVALPELGPAPSGEAPPADDRPLVLKPPEG